MKSVKFLIINNAFFHASIRTASNNVKKIIASKLYHPLYNNIDINISEKERSELNEKD